MLQQASAWLDRQRKAHLSSPVTYLRPATGGLIIVLATVGRTVFEINSDIGVLERVESRDFLVSAADLVLGGNVALPEPGDVIWELHGTQVLAYEVAAPGGEPCWRYADNHRVMLRIHTKCIGPITAE